MPWADPLSRGFFFSSRRRHTRYWPDWSSDVCSSDLHANGEPLRERRTEMRDTTSVVAAAVLSMAVAPAIAAPVPGEIRPAEIRVGSEEGDLRGKIGRASCRERV